MVSPYGVGVHVDEAGTADAEGFELLGGAPFCRWRVANLPWGLPVTASPLPATLGAPFRCAIFMSSSRGWPYY